MKRILKLATSDGRFVIVRVSKITAIESLEFADAFNLHLASSDRLQITEKSAIAVVEALAAWESELENEVEEIMQASFPASFPGYMSPAATHGAFPDDAECCKCGESYLQHQADEKRDKHVTKQRTCGKFSVVMVAPPKQAVTGG